MMVTGQDNKVVNTDVVLCLNVDTIHEQRNFINN